MNSILPSPTDNKSTIKIDNFLRVRLWLHISNNPYIAFREGLPNIVLPTTLVLFIPTSIGRIQGSVSLLLLGAALDGERELGEIKEAMRGAGDDLVIRDGVLIF